MTDPIALTAIVLAGTSVAACVGWWLTERRERALYGECKRLTRRAAYLENELPAERKATAFWKEQLAAETRGLERWVA